MANFWKTAGAGMGGPGGLMNGIGEPGTTGAGRSGGSGWGHGWMAQPGWGWGKGSGTGQSLKSMSNGTWTMPDLGNADSWNAMNEGDLVRMYQYAPQQLHNAMLPTIQARAKAGGYINSGEMINKYAAGGNAYDQAASDAAYQKYTIGLTQYVDPRTGNFLSGVDWSGGGGTPPVATTNSDGTMMRGGGGASGGERGGGGVGPLPPVSGGRGGGVGPLPPTGTGGSGTGTGGGTTLPPYTFGGSDGYTFGQGQYFDPGYDFRLGQGMKALQGSAAAKGRLLSGATLKGLNDYAQGSASQEFNNAYNRFAGDRAFNYGVDAADRQFGYNAAQDDRNFNYQTLRDLMNYGMYGTSGQAGSQNLLATLLLQNALAQGNVNAGGAIGGSNAINSVISQLLNQYLGRQYMGYGYGG